MDPSRGETAGARKAGLLWGASEWVRTPGGGGAANRLAKAMRPILPGGGWLWRGGEEPRGMRGRRRVPFQPSSDSYRTLSLERDHPEATISRSQEGLSAQRPQDSPEPDPAPLSGRYSRGSRSAPTLPPGRPSRPVPWRWSS